MGTPVFTLAPLPAPSPARRKAVSDDVRRGISHLRIGHDQVRIAIRVAQERFLTTGDEVDAVVAGITYGLAAEKASALRRAEPWPRARWRRWFGIAVDSLLIAVGLAALYVAAVLVGWLP